MEALGLESVGAPPKSPVDLTEVSWLVCTTPPEMEIPSNYLLIFFKLEYAACATHCLYFLFFSWRTARYFAWMRTEAIRHY
jgi:hypothetical protein